MILSFLFGCTHRRYTFPQLRVRRSGSIVVWRSKESHVCCLDCGAEAVYDLEAMRPDWNHDKPVRFQALREFVKGVGL